MLPLTVNVGDTVFVNDAIEDEQLQEIKIFLKGKKASWNRVIVSSATILNTISECLTGKKNPFSLHLNFAKINPTHNGDDCKSLMNLNLYSIQLDLLLSNPLWIHAFNYLNYNYLLTNTLTKLQLPRYLFTKEILHNAPLLDVFIKFLNNGNKQKLLSLTDISIEMDDELLPNEQQYANDFVFIDAINFKHPIYESLHIYCIDRLKVLTCPFDIFMVIIYGLFCNQFPFLQSRAMKKKKYTNDELFLVQTLKFPLNIEQLIIYPPILKKEMLLFVHSLQFKNSHQLNKIQFINWSVGHIASFCKAIQRLTYIHYENKLHKKNKYNYKHKRSKSNRHKSNKSMNIDEIIADVNGVNFNLQVLRMKAFFHHIHSFKISIPSSSLFGSRWEINKMDHTAQNIKNIKVKLIKKLYFENDYNDRKLMDKNICENDYIISKKSMKSLLLMGDILRYQFNNLFEFGLNNYLFLFGSKQFMIQLLNGIAFHRCCRNIELQGIGAERYKSITAADLVGVIKKSVDIANENQQCIDNILKKALFPKCIRIEIMNCMYGKLYGHKGTGILRFDVSSRNVCTRQLTTRTYDRERIQTKLDAFESVLEALDKNWIKSGLANSSNKEYWDWKKHIKKIHREINFHAM